MRGGPFFIGLFGAGLIGNAASMLLVMTILRADPVTGGFRGDGAFWSLFVVGQIPGLLATAALMARRLHDLGKSAIWAIAFFAYFGVSASTALAWPNLSDAVAIALMLPVFAMVIWLIVTPGDPEANGYGAAPTSSKAN